MRILEHVIDFFLPPTSSCYTESTSVKAKFRTFRISLKLEKSSEEYGYIRKSNSRKASKIHRICTALRKRIYRRSYRNAFYEQLSSSRTEIDSHVEWIWVVRTTIQKMITADLSIVPKARTSWIVKTEMEIWLKIWTCCTHEIGHNPTLNFGAQKVLQFRHISHQINSSILPDPTIWDLQLHRWYIVSSECYLHNSI